MKSLFAGIGSKKLMVLAALDTVLIEAGQRLGWPMGICIALGIANGCYFIGQGLADMGSEIHDGTPSSDETKPPA